MSNETTRVQCKCGNKFRVSATGSFHCSCPECGKRLSVCDAKKLKPQPRRSPSPEPRPQPLMTQTVSTRYATSTSQTASRKKKKAKETKKAKKRKRNFKSQAQLDREAQAAMKRYETVIKLLLLRRILRWTLIPLVCFGIFIWFVIDTMVLGERGEQKPEPKPNLPALEIPRNPPMPQILPPNNAAANHEENVRDLIDSYRN